MANPVAVEAAAFSSVARGTIGGRHRRCCRRLVVDTDLGLDDLVALAILRVQQCLHQQQQQQQLRHQRSPASPDGVPPPGGDDGGEPPPPPPGGGSPFRLFGVTLTSGVSRATFENATLLRRLLPPDARVYVASSSALADDDDDDDDIGGDGDSGGGNKPMWWTRTAARVTRFLSSLPEVRDDAEKKKRLPEPDAAVMTTTAERFVAENMDDPDTDFLCLAPLSTVAGALRLRNDKKGRRRRGSESDDDDDYPPPPSPPAASFYIMGGIREDSRTTGRAESTAPFGYRDVVAVDDDGAGDAPSSSESDDGRQGEEEEADRFFGEFNFALGIGDARRVLLAGGGLSSARIVPLEACTLVPKSLRPAPVDGAEAVAEAGGKAPYSTLSSILRRSSPEGEGGDDDDVATSGNGNRHSTDAPRDDTNFAGDDDDKRNKGELIAARSALRGLLRELGTEETQWDSIAAAIYCGALNDGDGRRGRAAAAAAPPTRVDPGKLVLSNLGALSFPGCRSPLPPDDNEEERKIMLDRMTTDISDEGSSNDDARRDHGHWIYPALSIEDEAAFFRYIDYLLHYDVGPIQ